MAYKSLHNLTLCYLSSILVYYSPIILLWNSYMEEASTLLL